MAELLSTSINGYLKVYKNNITNNLNFEVEDADNGNTIVYNTLKVDNIANRTNGSLTITAPTFIVKNTIGTTETEYFKIFNNSGTMQVKISPNTIINGTLNANNGKLSASGTTTTIRSDNFSITDTTLANGKYPVFFNIKKDTDGTNVTISSDTIITGSLSANNERLISNSSGTTIKNGATISSGNLSVSNGKLTVSGTAEIDGKLTAKSGADVKGAVNISNKIKNTANTITNLNVDGENFIVNAPTKTEIDTSFFKIALPNTNETTLSSLSIYTPASPSVEGSKDETRLYITTDPSNLLVTTMPTTIKNNLTVSGGKLSVNNPNGIEISYTNSGEKTCVFKADVSGATAYSNFCVKENREAEIVDSNGETRVKEESELIRYLNCDRAGLSINNDIGKTIFNIDSDLNKISGDLRNNTNGSFSIISTNNSDEKSILFEVKKR